MPSDDDALPPMGADAVRWTAILLDFNAALARGERPSIADYLNRVAEADRRQATYPFVRCDLECRLLAGEAARVEHYVRYLQQYTPPHGLSAAELELVEAEFHLRRKHGEPALSPDEYCERFPRLRDRLLARLTVPAPLPPPPIDQCELAACPSCKITPLKLSSEGGRQDRLLCQSCGHHFTCLGKYVLLDFVGAGTFGKVFKSYDTRLHRLVALKLATLPPTLSPDDLLASFQVEALLAPRLRHPNIVQVHDAGVVDDQCYLVLDFIDGRTLRDRMKRRVGWKQAVGWIATLADALAHIHAASLIHRDIKPENILLDASGTPYLTDLGLAVHENDLLRQQGIVAGTYRYMAPEQLRADAAKLDGRADIYSLGAVLYELLCGRPPFIAEDYTTLRRQILEKEPAPPSQYRSSVPEALNTTCRKALSKEPTDRFSDARLFARELKHALRPAPRQRPPQMTDPARNVRPPYTAQPPASPSFPTLPLKASLAKYLEQEKRRTLAEHAPGFPNLFVRDTVGTLFIPPPWKSVPPAESSELIPRLIACLSDALPRNIVLTGGPGQGKTTILKKLFCTLADSFISGTSPVFPLFLPFRFLAPHIRDEHFGTPEWLAEYLRKDAWSRLALSNPPFDLRADYQRPILLIDGLDELGSADQATINRLVSTPMFYYPAVLSCRRTFYDLYLSASPIQQQYVAHISLEPWDLARSGRLYIDAFCKWSGFGSTSSADLTTRIDSDPDLRDLSTQPLLLTMMLDVFGAASDQQDAPRDLAGLYERYLRNLLRYEASRPGSILDDWHKAAILERLAWALYMTRGSGEQAYGDPRRMTVTLDDLRRILHRLGKYYEGHSIDAAVEDVRLHSCMVDDDGGACSFIHKSFQEFYVALHICKQVRQSMKGAVTVFKKLIPPEVSIFVEDMLRPGRLTTRDRQSLSRRFIKAFQQSQGEDAASLNVRDHAIFYLATLRTDVGKRFLEAAYRGESDKVIQRSMMVGLGLFWGEQPVLDEYCHLIRSDAEAADVNMGYHLVYFGDQPQEEGYHDNRGRRCDCTVRALMDHLRDEKRFGILWTLDLITLRNLLERRGADLVRADESVAAFLRSFLQRPHPGRNAMFQEERQRLSDLLKLSR
jgi:serine/threonine protein kinase